MKIKDLLKIKSKDDVYDYYTRIIRDFKNYEKITKSKMSDEISNFYKSDYNNIINICTSKELKFLETGINKSSFESLIDDKHFLEHFFEMDTLVKKCIIGHDEDGDLVIFDDIIQNVKKAVQNVNWKEKKKKDKINEILVGFCLTHGEVVEQALLSICPTLTQISEVELKEHIYNDGVFNYYMYREYEYMDSLKKEIPVLVCNEYYYILDELREARKEQGLNSIGSVNIEKYTNIFYHGFDVSNKKIKKFLDKIEEYTLLDMLLKGYIKEYAMLNDDREPLKKAIMNSIYSEHYKDELERLCDLLDEAMDEMPSGALNGLTPNEAREFIKENEEYEKEKEKRNVTQKDACLSPKDAKLFYKIYFALLEYTNKKYNINKNVKIYNAKSINPYDIEKIIKKYWNYAKLVTKEFCKNNPYDFTEEELEITKGFITGVRELYAVAGFTEEYTLFLELKTGKVYMVKGINDNLDKVIDKDELPFFAETTIIQFKDVLIYDSLFFGFGINMGNGIDKMVQKEVNNGIKYYHL